jgi:hypothetical protein
MRSIRIVKQKQTEGANNATAESKKPDQPSTRKIANTVKSWVEDSKRRGRKQRRSLTVLGLLILIAFGIAMAQSPANGRALTAAEGSIKVSIATTDGFLGPPATQYRVGQEIPVAITMTNTSKDAVYACISSDRYQDLPRLTQDGKLVPYVTSQSYETMYARENHVCEEENLPEPVLLKPNEPRVADWFVLVGDGTIGDADAWYGSLPPGEYELTIQRRFDCCEGPMVQSNKIRFEVVQ